MKKKLTSILIIASLVAVSALIALNPELSRRMLDLVNDDKLSRGDTVVILGNCVEQKSGLTEYLNDEQVTISAVSEKGEFEGLRRSNGKGVTCEFNRITLRGKVEPSKISKVHRHDPINDLNKKILLVSGKCSGEILVDEVVDVLNVDEVASELKVLKRSGKKILNCRESEIRFEEISIIEARSIDKTRIENESAQKFSANSKARLLSGACFNEIVDPRKPENKRTTRMELAKAVVVLLQENAGQAVVSLASGSKKGMQLICDTKRAPFILEKVPAGADIDIKKEDN